MMGAVMLPKGDKSMQELPGPPAVKITACSKCGSTVFVQKRGKLATVIGVLLLFAAIIPGVLVLVFAPKHTRCARCGKEL
jgi:DNA-directed RNA polymerase subunit RPC12/RpoP